MVTQPKSAVSIVFGAGTVGNSPQHFSRITSLDTAGEMLDIFQSHGHKEIDTSRFYGSGSSEEYLGQLEWQKRGLVMDTKLYPTRNFFKDGVTLSPEHLRENLTSSLRALNAKKISIYYLHAPDRKTPIVDTLREINNLHEEGLFDKFGVSNYMAWEVAQISEICDRNGWIKPSVYQGVYNALHRTVEAELFPCLRHYGMGFYAFNPLGGGFFTGRLSRKGEVEKGSRFDPELWLGKEYRARYWNDAYFDALDIVRPVAEKHGLTLAEVALRWMTHHSLLGKEYPDAVLIGASSAKHIEQNPVDLDKDELPEDVVKALHSAWERVKPFASKYWH